MSVEKSEEFGLVQAVVDELYRERGTVRRLDAILLAETYGLSSDLQEVFELLPPGVYSRQRLCDQLNSSIAGHGWGYVYGTVE